MSCCIRIVLYYMIMLLLIPKGTFIAFTYLSPFRKFPIINVPSPFQCVIHTQLREQKRIVPIRETKRPHTSQIRNKKRRVRGADSFRSFLMGNGWRGRGG